MTMTTKDELAAMDQEELQSYFEANARYDPRNKKAPYGILFGGRALVSDDTHDLAKKFRAAVKRYKGSL